LLTRQYAAFIVEPIQGEGGVVSVEADFLHAAQALCRQTGTLFVVDEVQTGLGRVGKLFASELFDLEPDILTVAKALGGGLVPIGACMSSKHVQNDEFSIKHTSTFAGHGLGCAIGLTVLDILTKDDGAQLRYVRETGRRLRSRLYGLRNQFPHLIREVRGQGLMLGLSIVIDRYAFGRGLLATANDDEQINYLLMSYLLNHERIRVGLTLNDGHVLRVQPPLTTTWDECEFFLAGLTRTLQALATRDTGRMIAHLVHQDVSPADETKVSQESNFIKPIASSSAGRFAFLMHPLTSKSYVDFDRTLARFAPTKLDHLGRVFGDNFEPFLGGETQIISHADAEANGSFWIVPRTADDLRQMPRSQAVSEVQDAVNAACVESVDVIGLGAYTSTISSGGMLLNVPAGVATTPGNTYTSVVAFQSLAEVLRKQGRQLADLTVAILGANGSIGKALTALFSVTARRLILIGNDAHPDQAREALD
ncbi:MAG: aminotransferase class III-fold pyridoxal phosphate-dependent enzyme, partial [Myxococcota bacterium]